MQAASAENWREMGICFDAFFIRRARIYLDFQCTKGRYGESNARIHQSKSARSYFGGTQLISQEQLDNWFTYHSPTPDQLPKYLAVREAGKAFASSIVANSPDCADTTAAVRKVREAVMTANQAIACGGK